MHGHLYTNKSDNIYVNKKLKQKGSTKTFRLKEDTDNINPIFYISRDVDMSDVNYVEVEELHRYYYITDIEYSNQYYIVHCHVDALMSFKKCLDQYAITKRSADKFNLYINDDKMNLRAETRTLTFPFPSGFLVDGEKVANFILTVNGGGVS